MIFPPVCEMCKKVRRAVRRGRVVWRICDLCDARPLGVVSTIGEDGV